LTHVRLWAKAAGSGISIIGQGFEELVICMEGLTMKKSRKHIILILLLCMSIILPLTAAVSANSAEPPSLIIIVNNPPEDLSITLLSGMEQPKAVVKKVAWEGYYVFYKRDMKYGDKYTFRVAANGESFECTLSEPLKVYNNVYTLDLSGRELVPGFYPLRSVILVSMRVLLTLLTEGIVFWIFGFRQKRSWLVFLEINLVTQGTLNMLLNTSGSPLPNYLILGLIFGEFFVFIAEMAAFPVLIKEHKKSCILAYAFIANLISLILGFYIISYLPV